MPLLAGGQRRKFLFQGLNAHRLRLHQIIMESTKFDRQGAPWTHVIFCNTRIPVFARRGAGKSQFVARQPAAKAMILQERTEFTEKGQGS